jgi:hypothetical protein
MQQDSQSLWQIEEVHVTPSLAFQPDPPVRALLLAFIGGGAPG